MSAELETGHSRPSSSLWRRLLGPAILIALVLMELCAGSTNGLASRDLEACWHGTLRLLGLVAEPTDGSGINAQVSFENRLFETLVLAGVGALFATSGVLLQGLFRNGLAAPSLLGVSAGANVGTTLCLVLATSATAEGRLFVSGDALSSLVLSLSSIGGALAVSLLILGLARRSGDRPVTDLLLVGIAINATLAALLAAVQDYVRSTEQYRLLDAIQDWTLGSVDSRTEGHLGMVVVGLVGTFLLAPRITRELDLLQSGENDAESLGVSTGRVRALALGAACLATGTAVSAAGQIIFVGLVVPHWARALVGTEHRRVLRAAPFLGAALLLATDWIQYAIASDRVLRPGVMTSLLGGPFFLYLLLRGRTR